MLHKEKFQHELDIPLEKAFTRVEYLLPAYDNSYAAVLKNLDRPDICQIVHFNKKGKVVDYFFEMEVVMLL